MFNGQTTGRGLADLMVGALGSVEHGVPNLLVMDMVYAGLYAQDSWRLSDRVTFNYGVRWEPFLGQQMLYGGATNFDHDEFLKGTKSTVFLNAPPGMTYPGDAGFPDGKSGYHKRFLDFSPRAGVAWDVRGDGRLAIRSSYGLTYDFPSGDFMNINASAPPWGNRSLITTTRFDDPYAIVGGNPHPIATNANTVFPPFGAFGVMDPNIEPPRVQSWNVTVEQQLWTNWSVTANYLGRYSDHLWARGGPQPWRIPGSWSVRHQRRLVPGVQHQRQPEPAPHAQPREPGAAGTLGFVDQHNAVGWQTYHGLRLTMTRRAASGLSISGNYTLSTCEGTATPGSFAQIASGYTNPDDPDMDKGHCDQDRTHLANATVGYMIPEFDNRVLNIVASNWRTVGDPLGAVGPVDEHHHRPRQRAERPDRAASEPGVRRRVRRKDAEQLPEQGGVRRSRRQAPLETWNTARLKGRAYWDINLAVSKLINFGGSQSLELRIESFNLLNNFNWGLPTT